MQELKGNGKPIVDSHYIRPKKAEQLIKNAHNARQVTYICGATGYGKTSLVADMLSRRRYYYLQAEDMEKMLSEMDSLIAEAYQKKETIVILDDLHQIEKDESREMLLPRLQTLMGRKDVWMILISRSEIPGWLKSLYIRHVFIVVNEEVLTLTESEVRQYYDTWDIRYLDADIQKSIEVFQGYPLALRIYVLQLLSDGKNAGLIFQKTDEVMQRCARDLYDYYDVHVIDYWSIELQEFLMDLSIVERFDVNIARILTRRSDVTALLRRAEEIGSFLFRTEENPVQYEYRDLMRDSMERRLRIKKSQDYINDLYRRAGLYYEMEEDVINALKMYEQGNQKEGISNLLIKNVRQHVGSGHYWQLRKYYQKLSAEDIRQSPELMAGMSILQSILMNDAESERWYQELSQYVKESSGSERKRGEARLLYLDISLPQREITNIAELLVKAAVFVKERKNIFPELSLTNNQPSMMDGGKDFCEWSKRDTQLAKTVGKVAEFVLGDFGKGLINLALAESYLEKGGDYFEISMLAERGRLQASSGRKMEQVFVGVGIVSQLAILNHHYQDAVEMLDSLEKRASTEAPQIVDNIRALKTRYALYNGQIAEVEEWMAQAPNEQDEFCTLERYRYMTKVRVYLLFGKKEKAVSLLNQMLFFAESRKRVFLYIESKLLYAVAWYRLGKEEWIQILQEAVTKAEEYHFVRVFVREGAAVLDLLKDKRLVWTDRKYKEQILKECESQAKYYPNYLKEKADGIRLSEKALMILRMQADGMKNEAIAAELEMSVGNVKYHNTETYKKLGVKSKAAAITEAKKRNLM